MVESVWCNVESFYQTTNKTARRKRECAVFWVIQEKKYRVPSTVVYVIFVFYMDGFECQCL